MSLQRYVLDRLTHFIGRSFYDSDVIADNEARYNLLIKIINRRQLTHPPHDPTKPVASNFDARKMLSRDGLAQSSVVCFCDIPYMDLKLHMSKYRMFEISFPKKFLVDKG